MLLNGEHAFRLHLCLKQQIPTLRKGGNNNKNKTNVSVWDAPIGSANDAVLDSDLLTLFLLLAAEIKTARNYFSYRSNAQGCCEVEGGGRRLKCNLAASFVLRVG
jgi:hypothetical protein